MPNIRSKWSIESSQDFYAIHGKEAEDELLRMIMEKISIGDVVWALTQTGRQVMGILEFNEGAYVRIRGVPSGGIESFHTNGIRLATEIEIAREQLKRRHDGKD